MANPSNPILNTPVNNVLISDNTPILNFTIPTDIDSDNLVFQIELDTNNPINPSSSDYKKFESRLRQGTWNYWNGFSYIELPSAGVKQESYGQQANFTVPNNERLRNAIWYWKISCSDQLNCCTFDNGIFGEKKFCSGV